MEKLVDKQVTAGLMLGHELVGMLNDAAYAADRKDKEADSKVGGQFLVDRAALDPMEWGPIFRNFAEIISKALRPELIKPPLDRRGREEQALLEIRCIGQRSNVVVGPSRAERKAAKWADRVLKERRR
jgi:hypothetical protein